MTGPETEADQGQETESQTQLEPTLSGGAQYEPPTMEAPRQRPQQCLCQCGSTTGSGGGS